MAVVMDDLIVHRHNMLCCSIVEDAREGELELIDVLSFIEASKIFTNIGL